MTGRAPVDTEGERGAPALAVVTGASQGIGVGIADELARAGHDIAIWTRDAAAAGEVARSIADQHGVRATATACDVRDERSVADALSRLVQDYGEPTVLVNNAAVRSRGPLEDLPAADWDDVMDTNLRGPFVCSQQVGRMMLARGTGSIVNIASVSAVLPQGFLGAYTPSKAGLLALTRQMAVEWGPRGVRCNSVSPGFVPTAAGARSYAVPGLAAQREAMVPLRRLGTPQDIGRAVAFLASAAASYINGVDIVVDGGFTLTLLDLIPTIGPDGQIVNARIPPA
jgi:glucose 1-dehydrogenase